MAVIQCTECERKLKVSDGLAGRKVRCPQCKAVIEVPPTEDFAEDSPKSQRRAAVEPDVVEERPEPKPRSRRFEEDDDARPRRRRDGPPAKSNKGLVIGLCLGLGVLVIGGGVLAFFLLGRGPAVDTQSQNDMKMIGLAYHSHLSAFGGKPPARAEDLQPYLAESPTAFQRLKSGQVVFLWNVAIKDMTTGSSNTILSYANDAPLKGGLALFGDGSVRVLSRVEFQKTAMARAGVPPINPAPMASAWKEYVSTSGTYTILLPQNASAKEETAVVKDVNLPVFSLRARLPDQSLYQVILTQFGPKFIADNPRAALLQQFRDAVITKVNGQIIEESKTEVANEPAVNASLRVPGPGKGYVRVFIVNNALYQLLVLGPENSPYGKDATKFFDSFKISSKDKEAPAAAAKTKGNNIPKAPNTRTGTQPAQKFDRAKLYREAALKFEKMAPLDPKTKAWNLKEAAVNWLKAQDKEKALAAAKAAIAGEPEKRSQLLTHFWHRGLGEVFLQTGEYPLAIEHIEKAIQNTNIEGYIKDCQKLLNEAKMKNGK